MHLTLPGAYIPSPSFNDLDVGPFEIHFYGLTFALAIAVGAYICNRRWKAVGGTTDVLLDALLWAVPAGVIGGRIYFDLTSTDEVPPHWWGPFAVWHGGLGSWGAFSAAVLVALWRVKRSGASPALGLDAAAPAFLVSMAIGRFANYMNQELFGKPSTLPWAVEIEPANRPDGYKQFATFQPTFFYEAAWDLALAGFLVWLGRSRDIKPPGLFALFVTGYSAFRIFEELIRIDPSDYILGLRLNFFVACLGTIAGAIWFAWTQGWLRGRRGDVDSGRPRSSPQ